MMDILENRERWYEDFSQGWLAQYQKTGDLNWDCYKRPSNHQIPAGPGIDIGEARLLLLSTAGGYLKDQQEPFDAANPLGDYSLRTFPTSTAFDQIEFSHDHYDHFAVREDPEVLLPLRHLEDMVIAGKINELTESVISLMGYQPDVTRTLDETIPAVLSAAKEMDANAALLIPA